MDVLDDILTTLDLRGALYFRTDFSAPWAVRVPDHEQAARFHLVIDGRCHVGFPSGRSLLLGPGDLLLIPGGRAHVLADAPGRDAPALETVLHEAGYDGDGVLVLGGGDPLAATQMLCGHFTFRAGADHPLLRALPEFLLTGAADRAREPWLDDVLRLIARRLYEDRPGSAAVVTRLSEIVYIEVLRRAVAQEPALVGLLQAFRDPQIGRALHLMHRQPAEAWSVQSLARAAGMSRSRFAERFADLLQTGPMAYLADWRLQKALALLVESRLDIRQIAGRTGYRSPAAFTRAFAARFGCSPREYRQNDL